MEQRARALRDKYLNNPIVELEKPHTDDRGSIIPILDDEKMESCVIIGSKKGTVRANHFHKTDWHYCYLTKGEIEYFWRETGDDKAPMKVVIHPGQCFFTPPMVDHAMVFTQDSEFICLGKNPRDQESYEADIERINLVQL